VFVYLLKFNFNSSKGNKEKAEFCFNEALKNQEYLEDRQINQVQKWLKELQGQK